MKKSNLAVITLAVGERGRELLDITRAGLERYANRIGADFHIIGGEPIQPAYPMEDKFRVCQYLDHYDRVIYIDADIEVSQDAPNLFDMVPETHLGICDEVLYGQNHSWTKNTIPELQRAYGFEERHPDSYYNTGLMVLNPTHRHLVAPPTKPYRVHHTAEQDLINARIEHHRPAVHSFGPDLVWLWVADKRNERKAGRPFLHYAGAGNVKGAPGHLALMRQQPWTSVDGWFSDHDAATYSRLLKALAPGETIVEIGTHKGRSAVFAASFRPDCRLHCVDIWDDDDIYQQFQKNAAGYSNITHNRTTSVKAAKTFKGCAGVVFVDGNHNYESVLADIKAWLPHLRAGGIICGHDYQYDESVKRAVAELLPEHQSEGNVWWSVVSTGKTESPWHLINLPRRPDRLKAALEEFEKIGVTPKIVEGVDGHTLPLPDGWTAGAGAYGCSLSHRRIIEDTISAGRNEVIVFEDDVTFVPNFNARFQEFMARVPPDWDAVFIGGQHMEPPENVGNGVLKAANVHRTHGYILRGEYMRFIYQKWASEPGHVDHVWGRHQREWKVYTPDKWLCGQSAGASDISGRKLTERYWQPRRVAQRPLPPRKPCACKGGK